MLTKILSYFLLLFINTNFSYQSYAQPNIKNSNDHLISSLKKLKLNGRFDFDNTSNVAYDFGNRFYYIPLAILFPKTVSDISTTIKYVYKKSRRFSDQLTVTARGHGHSLEGQSQNEGGIVISMESLEEPRFFVHIGEDPYVDALGGELWINVLYESIKYGLTPKSWTDFLYLSVGGTLSNGGFSGEAFKHGPQINSSNVYQLEVVTGKGDIVNCSEKQNADLFYGVLGGLGQFGIITKARISLQVAPKLVKWIKILYSEFNLFTKDQENIISLDDTFDYIEGFVLTNVESNMTSNSSGKTLYGLEVAKFFNPDEKNTTNKKIDEILGKLNYLSHTFLESEVTYVEFLDRLHVLPELMVEDRSNVANLSFPWLNLLVPKSSILTFGEVVFNHILSNITYSPILIYPFNQSRWKDKTSMVTPQEDVIYLVAFLTSAKTYSSGLDGLENMLTINKKILDFVKKENLGVKQYLPYHDTLHEWQAHFGKRWDVFSRRKKSYDPLSILSPKQRIFQRGQTIS